MVYFKLQNYVARELIWMLSFSLPQEFGPQLVMPLGGKLKDL